MNELLTLTSDTDPSTLTRRLFAGGMLAGLAAAGMALPAAGQGLKDVDEDEDREERDDEREIPEEWEDLGITGQYSYESPQFGYTVEWEAPWMLDPDDPATSDPGMQTDEVVLVWEPGAAQSVGVAVLGIPADAGGIVGLDEFLVSPQGKQVWFADKYETEDLLINNGDTSFEYLILLTDPEVESFSSWVFLVGTEVTPGDWVLATLVSSEEMLEETFEGLSDQLYVNGGSVVSLTTWRDIKRAIN
jgi:hypothetical protein